MKVDPLRDPAHRTRCGMSGDEGASRGFSAGDRRDRRLREQGRSVSDIVASGPGVPARKEVRGSWSRLNEALHGTPSWVRAPLRTASGKVYSGSAAASSKCTTCPSSRTRPTTVPRSGENDKVRTNSSKSGKYANVAAARYISPSRFTMCAVSAPHNRAAVSHSVSSTGCRSKVERLMTFSTSLVAVWYSSEFLQDRACARAIRRAAAHSPSRSPPARRSFRAARSALSENGRASCRYDR